jgi:hypothetical protein
MPHGLSYMMFHAKTHVNTIAWLLNKIIVVSKTIVWLLK